VTLDSIILREGELQHPKISFGFFLVIRAGTGLFAMLAFGQIQEEM